MEIDGQSTRSSLLPINPLLPKRPVVSYRLPCARTGISYKSHQHAVSPALLVPVKETILAESQLLGSYRYSTYPLATASPVWTSDTSFHAHPFRPA